MDQWRALVNVTSTGNAECLKKELYNGIPNVTYLQRWIVCTPSSVNVFVTLATCNIWNTIAKLFLKHPDCSGLRLWQYRVHCTIVKRK
jgi:hypothetical protein